MQIIKYSLLCLRRRIAIKYNDELAFNIRLVF